MAPTSSSTSYYDDGLWHTYYPVKSFPTQTVDWSVESSMREANAYATAVPKVRRSLSVEEAVQQAMDNAQAYATTLPLIARSVNVEVVNWNETETSS